MTFAQSVAEYIRTNYDISRMRFYHGASEVEFEDWVEECIDLINEHSIVPYGHEFDVATVGDKILSLITDEYRPLYGEVSE